MYTHVPTNTHLCMGVFAHPHMHAHTLHTDTHACMYMYVHALRAVYIYICASTPNMIACAHPCAHKHMCVHILTHVLSRAHVCSRTITPLPTHAALCACTFTLHATHMCVCVQPNTCVQSTCSAWDVLAMPPAPA